MNDAVHIILLTTIILEATYGNLEVHGNLGKKFWKETSPYRYFLEALGLIGSKPSPHSPPRPQNIAKPTIQYPVLDEG